MPNLKKYSIHARNLPAGANRTVRKQLNADAIFAMIKDDLKKVPDTRARNTRIALDDIFMSALAMFHLKDPSLLQFDQRRWEEPENLHTLYGIKKIPSDSQMRAALAPQDPGFLRVPFATVHRLLQRGNEL